VAALATVVELATAVELEIAVESAIGAELVTAAERDKTASEIAVLEAMRASGVHSVEASREPGLRLPAIEGFPAHVEAAVVGAALAVGALAAAAADGVGRGGSRS